MLVNEMNNGGNGNQNGAALITVLMIAALLSIASIAILTSVGKNSQNSTDVLGETKAYYAAESGLQASINVLRHYSPGVTYSEALTYPNLEKGGWLTYNCNPSDVNLRRVSIGPNPCDIYNGTSYKVTISDPDNTAASLTFSTVGSFLNSNVATTSVPSATDANRTTFSFSNVTNCVVLFPSNNHCAPNQTSANSLFATLNVQITGTGAPQSSTNVVTPFSIQYSIVAPRVAERTVKGTITRMANTNTLRIKMDPNTYLLMGTTFKICQTDSTTSCPPFQIDVALGNTTIPLYMKTTPVEPYRLKVISVGYGPNGARKQLEGIIQKNFFNDLSGPAAITMQGTGAGMVFSPGNSSVFRITGQDGTSGAGFPSVGVIDQTGLNTVNNNIPNNNNNILPAPAIVSDLPDWMTTPQKLDQLVTSLRTTAQNSGRYFVSPSQNLNYVGNYANGTGITFCEGDCTAGVDGGGILVVTGTLRNVGGWSFKGLIIITGPGGWERQGGGNGTITGNVVIAPYGSAQLASNVFSLPPKYAVTGSGVSGVVYDDLALNTAFDGTSSISNFMLGVAEK